MGYSENNAMSADELKEKLISIKNDMKLGKLKHTELKEKYGISLFALGDLSDMTSKDFDDFLEQIPYIKQKIQNGNIPSKIAAELACGTQIVSFVVKQTCQDYSKNRAFKEIQYKEFLKKIEGIWKEQQQGVKIETLAAKYNMHIEELEQVLNNFDSSIKKKQKYFRRIHDVEIKNAKAELLKEKWGLDDDTIAYIVYRKEIKKLEKEEGVSLDEP